MIAGALRLPFPGDNSRSEPCSVDAIARELGVSRERVRQLERTALQRLEGELASAA